MPVKQMVSYNRTFISFVVRRLIINKLAKNCRYLSVWNFEDKASRGHIDYWEGSIGGYGVTTKDVPPDRN